MPIFMAAALELQQSPTFIVVFIAFACNSAFMLPVATPPNAIVFGSGLICKKDMLRMGVRMNLMAWIIISLYYMLTSIRFN